MLLYTWYILGTENKGDRQELLAVCVCVCVCVRARVCVRHRSDNMRAKQLYY